MFLHQSELDDSHTCCSSYLVNPAHVVLELLQILDVSITNLANDKASFALLSGLSRSRLILLLLWLRCRARAHHASGIVALANTLKIFANILIQ